MRRARREAVDCVRSATGALQRSRAFDARQHLFDQTRSIQHQTDALISGVADVLREQGINLLDSTAFLAPLLAREGVLTKRAPNDEELADLECGSGWVAKRILKRFPPRELGGCAVTAEWSSRWRRHVRGGARLRPRRLARRMFWCLMPIWTPRS